MTEERRRKPRIKSANLVSFKTFAEKKVLTNLGMGATQDLNDQGISLYCNECFPVPTELTLDLALGEEIIHVKGRVVRVEEVEEGEKYLIGIRFVDVPAGDRAKIQKYVQAKEE